MVKIKKLPKDPKAPKLPRTPFIYYCMEAGKDVRDELSKDPSLLGSDTKFQLQGKISKACGIRWHALSASEKEKYDNLYKEDIKRYQEELKFYTPSAEYLDKVNKAKLENSRSVANNPDSNIAKIPHVVRAYFDFLTTTWPKIAASNLRLNPQQVQEEVWRRWNRGETGCGDSSSNNWDENRNVVIKPIKRKMSTTSSEHSTSQPSPRPAFQCYLEQMKEEVRKQLPDLPYSEVVKHVSAKWKIMTDKQKEPYFVMEREEKEKNGGLLKRAKSEVEIKDPSVMEDSVASYSAEKNNKIFREDVEDDNRAAAKKMENEKIENVLMTDDAEEGNNVDVTDQKEKDDRRSQIKVENTSSSSSSDDSSGDDSDSTSSDSESDSDKEKSVSCF